MQSPEIDTPVFSREILLEQLSAAPQPWDVLVIGGGATGLGVALDAVSRGYRTLLVEQCDFAKGTSSRSTKLVHGGVRYLAQGDVALVREASIERGLLQRNAPHLVKNQVFIIPVYGFFSRIKYTFGLKLYDWISGKLSLGPSKFISPQETAAALPDVKTKGLVGGVSYHDGQFDDARLALNLAQTIVEKGGCAINYMRVQGLVKDNRGKICGAELSDVESGKTYMVNARAVINATGVFTDDILKMDNPQAPKTVIASQGIHLVLDKKFFNSSCALMIPETSDGRVLFAVPWHNEVILGTTDTPVDKPALEPAALEKEITFILQTAGNYLKQKPARENVLSVFAGLRPLAAPKETNQKTKEISRSHKIIISPSGLFSMIGGKWTTYRKMGEDMMDTVEEKSGWLRKPSATRDLHVHGYITNTDWNDPLYFYGSDAVQMRQQMNGNTARWLSERLKIDEEQVVWAVRHEMARTVEDVLARRTRALFLDAKESIRIAHQVAVLMARLLGKDENWVAGETAQYRQLASRYVLEP